MHGKNQDKLEKGCANFFPSMPLFHFSSSSTVLSHCDISMIKISQL